MSQKYEGTKEDVKNAEKQGEKEKQRFTGREDSHLVLVVPNIFAFIHRKALNDFRGYIKSKLGMKVSVHIINWAWYPAKLVRVV